MFKNIIILAVFALFVGGAMTQACSDNPVIEKLDTFLAGLESSFNNKEAFTAFSNAISTLKSATKSNVTGLEKCKGYNG